MSAGGGRWFFAPALESGEVRLSEEESRHIARVLRLRAGDVLTLFDGAGRYAAGELISDVRAAPARRSGASAAVVRVMALAEQPPPARPLTLVVPGCKGERLDWLVEKCTELGAARLVFAEFERSVVHVADSHLERLRRHAIEACKQCRRARLPEISVAGNVRAALSIPAGPAAAQRPGQALLVADPHESTATLGGWLSQASPGGVTAVVGPEGGLTPDESRRLLELGATPVRLGEFVLRVETAAIAIAAAVAAAGADRPQ